MSYFNSSAGKAEPAYPQRHSSHQSPALASSSSATTAPLMNPSQACFPGDNINDPSLVSHALLRQFMVNTAQKLAEGTMQIANSRKELYCTLVDITPEDAQTASIFSEERAIGALTIQYMNNFWEALIYICKEWENTPIDTEFVNVMISFLAKAGVDDSVIDGAKSQMQDLAHYAQQNWTKICNFQNHQLYPEKTSAFSGYSYL